MQNVVPCEKLTNLFQIDTNRGAWGRNDDLRDNYGVENPSQAIFDLFIQGSKHYDKFTSSIGELMRLEQYFMNRGVGGRVNNILDLNRVYVENIGNIFIKSMNFENT